MKKQGSWDSEEEGGVEEWECETPKHQKISSTFCPSPPRKKRAELKYGGPPPGGFFNSPELEIFFANAGNAGA
ncbi:hypothetical protein SUGI_0869540 [Cryptomeria japonica]|nr:hypothetical protein SUGI_0869540 [Cryptomeria japonica]